MAGGAVDFSVPAATAYDYLVEPTNRPQWQSSLRTVVVPAGWVPGADAHAGLRWVDVTWPGLRPRMALTEAERPHRWSESGEWGPFRAELTLTFTPRGAGGSGCVVAAECELRPVGLLRPVGAPLTALAVRPVLADLRRAARLLEGS